MHVKTNRMSECRIILWARPGTPRNLDPFSAHEISISLASRYTKILVDAIYVTGSLGFS